MDIWGQVIRTAEVFQSRSGVKRELPRKLTRYDEVRWPSRKTPESGITYLLSTDHIFNIYFNGFL